MKKRYLLEHFETNFSATIEIDFDHITADQHSTEEIIKETVEFWSGWQRELALFDGDYTQCFLAKLGRILAVTDAYYNLDTKSMIKHMAGEEGWPYLDGSSGITLKSIDNGYIEITDIAVTEC